MLIFAQLEDAIIARVKNASDSNALGYRLASVSSYGGELDDDTFFTQSRRFPAVWVTVAGDKPKRISGKVWQCALTVVVMVGTRNVRGERFTRHGSVGEVGSYQLLQDVRDLLVGQSLELPLAALALGASRTLFNTRLASEARAVMSAEFTTDYTYRLPALVAGDAAPGDLRGLGLRYYLKPGDDVPDVTDILEMGA